MVQTYSQNPDPAPVRVPWENGYAESFHARLRDELLNAEVFDGLHDAKTLGAK